MTPRLLKSPLTGQWYIVTRYSIKHSDDCKELLTAHRKYEVTEQMEGIIDDAIEDFKRGQRNEVDRGMECPNCGKG